MSDVAPSLRSADVGPPPGVPIFCPPTKHMRRNYLNVSNHFVRQPARRVHWNLPFWHSVSIWFSVVFSGLFEFVSNSQGSCPKKLWINMPEFHVRHFYFSHRPSPLMNNTLRSNTLQGVDFGSILGQFLVSFGQKPPKPTKNWPKTDRKPTQNWPSPGSQQVSTPKKRGGSVAEIKVLIPCGESSAVSVTLEIEKHEMIFQKSPWRRPMRVLDEMTGVWTTRSMDVHLYPALQISLVAPSTGWMLYYLCFSPSTAIGPPLR